MGLDSEKRNFGMFRDDRGVLLWASPSLLNFDYKYLTIGSIRPGCTRGGHFHKRTFEQFMCIGGEITYFRDGEKSVLGPGDIIDIPLDTVHTFVNNGAETAYFVEFKSVEFDEDDPDTFHRDSGKK